MSADETKRVFQEAPLLPLTDECHHYTSRDEVPANIQKYWSQRYSIFQHYDHGIYMTDDAWFGVTPEAVANKISTSPHLPTRPVLIDLFAGAGGNSISFALSGRWNRVIAVEKNPAVLACAQRNARVYEVEEYITFVNADAFEYLGALRRMKRGKGRAGEESLVMLRKEGGGKGEKNVMTDGSGDSGGESADDGDAGEEQTQMGSTSDTYISRPGYDDYEWGHDHIPSDNHEHNHHNAATTTTTPSKNWPFELINSLQVSLSSQEAVLFASPPWGGPGYTDAKIFDLQEMRPYSLRDLYGVCRGVSCALYLPRTSDVRQIGGLVGGGGGRGKVGGGERGEQDGGEEEGGAQEGGEPEGEGDGDAETVIGKKAIKKDDAEDKEEGNIRIVQYCMWGHGKAMVAYIPPLESSG